MNANYYKVKIKNSDKEIYLLRQKITFSERYLSRNIEKETIKWIDSFQRKDIFFDIGANVGLYSLYSAKSNICTYSFEPHVFNFLYLLINIEKNKCKDLITPVNIAIHNKTVLEKFHYKGMYAGASKNSIEINATYDHSFFVPKTSPLIQAYRLDDLIKTIPKPTHIKIDTDGNEGDILEGAQQTLKSCKSILIEVVGYQKNKIASILSDHNFELSFINHRNAIYTNFQYHEDSVCDINEGTIL